MSEAPQAAERDAAIAEEQARLRQLRMVVDLTANVLVQGAPTREEADALVAAARRRVLSLFPDKEDTYELILAPRFERLIEENFGGPARVPPFARR